MEMDEEQIRELTNIVEKEISQMNNEQLKVKILKFAKAYRA